MSCIFFGAHELANVVRAASAGAHGGEAFAGEAQRVADALAIVSKANARAFIDRYPRDNDPPVPVTAGEILAVAAPNGRALPLGDLRGALSTAGLLRYNCHESKDFLAETEGGLDALAYVLERLVFAWADDLDARPKVKAPPAADPFARGARLYCENALSFPTVIKGGK